MKTFSLYNAVTGHFIGRQFSSDIAEPTLHAAVLAANTPAGHGAVDGSHDHLSRRLDPSTGEVVDYQPPQPSPAHEWHAESKRWHLSAAAQAKAAATDAARARIAALEAASGPLVRKAVLGDAAALASLKALDDEVLKLREMLQST